MLLSIWATSDVGITEKILLSLICIIALLPALTFHEWGHGFIAYKLGDRTAKADGRLSLNPLDHLDPVGSIMMLFIGFGWAKPVPVNTRNFKKPRRDMALVSLAGPMMNFIVAFISTIISTIAYETGFALGLSSADGMSAVETIVLIVQVIFEYSAILNIGLGCFNLIPIPPLDGSNILMCILPQKAAMHYSKIRYYTRYIFLGLILLSWLPWPFSAVPDIVLAPMYWARSGLTTLFEWLAKLIVLPFFEFI